MFQFVTCQVNPKIFYSLKQAGIIPNLCISIAAKALSLQKKHVENKLLS